KNFSRCSVKNFLASGSIMLRWFSLISMVCCSSHSFQALSETVSCSSCPFLLGNGGCGIFGNSCLYLRQKTVLACGLKVSVIRQSSLIRGIKLSCRILVFIYHNALARFSKAYQV